MIPIRDTLETRTTPLVNTALVLACSVTFGWEMLAGGAAEMLVNEHGLVPARFFTLGDRQGFLDPALYTPFVSSLFLHGGLAHLLVNMLFLWIFGDDVEDHFGHVGYLAFYLCAGVFAALVHLIAHAGSVVPTIGASGAIAGVMGAYLLFHPRAGIVSFVFPLFWLTFRVPAVVYLVLWLGFQLAMAMRGAPGAGEPGIAWWTHLAGFGFGVLVAGVSLRRRRTGAARA